MAAKKVGDLIKEARTKAGLTQAGLAEKVTGASSADISKAERGEKQLTDAQLKEIAKATGVTQKSLLEAPKGSSSSSSSKTTTTKTTSSKTASKTSTKTSTSKTTSSTSSNTIKVNQTEKTLVTLYRKADSTTKETVMKLLKGEKLEATDIVGSLLTNAASGSLGSLLEKFTGK